MMDIFTLLKLKEFIEQRIKQNCSSYYPEPDFDNEVIEELWKVRAFICEAIKIVESEQGEMR